MLERTTSRQRREQRANGREGDRWRRYRARRDAGTVVDLVEVDSEIIDALIRWRWLHERDAGDRRKRGAAITALLRDAARRR